MPVHLVKLAELITRALAGDASVTGLTSNCHIDCGRCEIIGSSSDDLLPGVNRFVVTGVEMAIRGKTIMIRPKSVSEEAVTP